jgi:hypothetical protein
MNDVNELWSGRSFHTATPISLISTELMWTNVGYLKASSAVLSRETRCAVAGSSAIIANARSRL